jgi:hypothetical protein
MRRIRKVAGSCLATAAVTAALIPFGLAGGSAQAAVAATSPAIGQAAATGQAAASGTGCAGTDEQLLPATGGITNYHHTDGGFYYYTISQSGLGRGIMCIGRVREWVYYASRGTKTWRVTIDGEHVASETFPEGTSGWYYWDFQINSEFYIGQVCVGASSTPGYSCAAP